MNLESQTNRFAPYFYRTLSVLVALFIVTMVLQPLLPKSWAMVLIALRYIIVPGFIVAFCFTVFERVLFVALFVGWVLIELQFGTGFDSEDEKVLLSVLGSLPYLKAGMMLASNRNARVVWNGILFSVLFLNIITIAIYVNTLRGGSISSEIFASTQRENEDPLFRFAIGNAIEVPALLALATAASSIVLGGRTPLNLISLVMNLIGSFISQSRMVFIISCYALVRMRRYFNRIAIGAAIVMVLAGMFVSKAKVYETGEETWASLLERFHGNDAGSAENRMDIVGLLRENINLAALTFGNGINSSFHLMGESGMGYVSFDSALLQTFYDAGLLRLLALALFIIYMIRKADFRLQWRGEFLLGFAQVFLLLPIHGYTAMNMFSLGALCINFKNQASPEMASSGKLVSQARLVQPALEGRQ